MVGEESLQKQDRLDTLAGRATFGPRAGDRLHHPGARRMAVSCNLTTWFDHYFAHPKADKAFRKTTAARTVDDLWDAIAQGIDTFTPTECQNYFAAAGYDRE